MKILIFKTFDELKILVKKDGRPLPEILKLYESQQRGITVQEVKRRMEDIAQVMKASIAKGLEKKNRSHTGMINGGAYLLKKNAEGGKGIICNELSEIIYNIMAVSELNACMGKVATAPTAGACGAIPGVLMTVAKYNKFSERKIVDALFIAGAVGEIISNGASLAGARHGCQAENGSASAMLAAALVSLFAMDIEKIESAAAFALKNLLGLICDPIGGFVEIPCVKRNVVAGFNAIAAAEMALAGIKTVIPFDQVVYTMKKVGDKMDDKFKETARGGLAATPAAKDILKKQRGHPLARDVKKINPSA